MPSLISSRQISGHPTGTGDDVRQRGPTGPGWTADDNEGRPGHLRSCRWSRQMQEFRGAIWNSQRIEKRFETSQLAT
jgi:hypothetical protein